VKSVEDTAEWPRAEGELRLPGAVMIWFVAAVAALNVAFLFAGAVVYLQDQDPEYTHHISETQFEDNASADEQNQPALSMCIDQSVLPIDAQHIAVGS
jgi:hypothetical protein